jgi:hypothetical protein
VSQLTEGCEGGRRVDKARREGGSCISVSDASRSVGSESGKATLVIVDTCVGGEVAVGVGTMVVVVDTCVGVGVVVGVGTMVVVVDTCVGVGVAVGVGTMAVVADTCVGVGVAVFAGTTVVVGIWATVGTGAADVSPDANPGLSDRCGVDAGFEGVAAGMGGVWGGPQT